VAVAASIELLPSVASIQTPRGAFASCLVSSVWLLWMPGDRMDVAECPWAVVGKVLSAIGAFHQAAQLDSH
jgi:hypothetical protein